MCVVLLNKCIIITMDHYYHVWDIIQFNIQEFNSNLRALNMMNRKSLLFHTCIDRYLVCPCWGVLRYWEQQVTKESRFFDSRKKLPECFQEKRSTLMQQQRKRRMCGFTGSSCWPSNVTNQREGKGVAKEPAVKVFYVCMYVFIMYVSLSTCLYVCIHVYKWVC